MSTGGPHKESFYLSIANKLHFSILKKPMRYNGFSLIYYEYYKNIQYIEII